MASAETPDKKKKHKKDKKRKRDKTLDNDDDDNNNNPTSAKHLYEPPAPTEEVEATVKVIPEKPERSLPLVGYFPSGYNPVESGSVEAKIYKHRAQKMAKRMQVVVRPKGLNVGFVGSSYADEAATPQVCDYTLGVFDKETKTLKIVPIAANKIFRLEPRVRGVAYSEPSDLEREELTTEKRAQKLRELTATYGTKKSINQAKKMHALNEDADPNAQKQLDTEIKELEINKDALAGTSAQAARNIPDYDLSATTPETAYPLDKIIVKGEWGFLEDIYNLLQEGAEISSDSYPTFVCNRVYRLREMKDEEKKRLSGIFSYITHLVKFKDQHSVDGFASAKNHRIPSMLYQKFTSMFTNSGSKKKLSPEKIDLLISYILVLTLFADDFRSDPTDIAKDLRVNAVSLRAHYENLGCKLSRQDKILHATLPVPLQFPTVRQRRRRA